MATIDNKDHVILAQSASNHASQIVAGMHIDNVNDACQAFATLHDFIHTTVLGCIGQETVAAAFPGAEIQTTPAQAQPVPQTGPGPQPGMAPVTQFPTAGQQPDANPFPGPAPMPAPAQFNPAQAVYQGGPPASVQSSSPEEQLWIEYFNDPSQWFDNRVDKKNPKGPDFRHKSRKDPQSGYNVGLWMNRAPDWAKQRLGAA